MTVDMNIVPEIYPELPPPSGIHREQDWRAEVLTSKEELRGILKWATGAWVDENFDADVQASGGVTLLNLEQDFPIDWMSDRLRLYRIVNGEEFLLGTFLVTFPGEEQTATERTLSVDLLGKVAILQEDAIEKSQTLKKGANIVNFARSIITSTGETRVTIEASTKTAREDTVWPAGTSKIEVVNDCMEMLNYFGISCDRTGRFVSKPYVLPEDRPIVRTFEQGLASIHRPTWARSADLSKVPNRVIARTVGSEEEPALVGVASNTNPDSPFSYANRGNRWIVHTEEGVEAADQATINAIAQRLLVANSSPASALNVEHAFVPLDLHDRVAFIDSGTETTATVRTQSIRLGAADLVQAEWREVLPL